MRKMFKFCLKHWDVGSDQILSFLLYFFKGRKTMRWNETIEKYGIYFWIR